MKINLCPQKVGIVIAIMILKNSNKTFAIGENQYSI
jgi:hypothetical protein